MTVICMRQFHTFSLRVSLACLAYGEKKRKKNFVSQRWRKNRWATIYHLTRPAIIHKEIYDDYGGWLISSLSFIFFLLVKFLFFVFSFLLYLPFLLLPHDFTPFPSPSGLTLFFLFNFFFFHPSSSSSSSSSSTEGRKEERQRETENTHTLK